MSYHPSKGGFMACTAPGQNRNLGGQIGRPSVDNFVLGIESNGWVGQCHTSKRVTNQLLRIINEVLGRHLGQCSGGSCVLSVQRMLAFDWGCFGEDLTEEKLYSTTWLSKITSTRKSWFQRCSQPDPQGFSP